jgi:hypothetical protein
LIHVALGILANVTTAQTVEEVRLVAEEVQNKYIMTTPSGSAVPEEVTKEALRLVSIVINRGVVDEEWQREGYKYHSSAPRAE